MTRKRKSFSPKTTGTISTRESGDFEDISNGLRQRKFSKLASTAFDPSAFADTSPLLGDSGSSGQDDGDKANATKGRRRFTTSGDDEMFSITGHSIVIFCCFLPLAALFSCVVLALVLHFEESTKTHCGVSFSCSFVVT